MKNGITIIINQSDIDGDSVFLYKCDSTRAGSRGANYVCFKASYMYVRSNYVNYKYILSVTVC